jgi:hypothetical protein
MRRKRLSRRKMNSVEVAGVPPFIVYFHRSAKEGFATRYGSESATFNVGGIDTELHPILRDVKVVTLHYEMTDGLPDEGEEY